MAGFLVAALPEERDDALGRLAPDESVSTVDHDTIALPDLREELRHADHGGNPEGTREDCGVRRAAAALGHEAHDTVAGNSNGVGRRELVRHEDDGLSCEVLHPQARVLFAAEMLFQDSRDVVDVGSVMRKVLVRQTPEARRQVGGRFGDRPLGIDLLVRDPSLDRAEKGAVLQEQGVRLEDPGVLGAKALLHVPGRGLDFASRGFGRAAEPLDLRLDLLRLERASGRGVLSRNPEYGTPDGDAG